MSRAITRAFVVAAFLSGLSVEPAFAQGSPDPSDTTAAPPDGAAGDAGGEAPPTTALVTTTSTVPGSTTTSTTLAPARCDTIPPVAAVFTGTVIARGPDSVKFSVDDVRSGTAGREEQVVYVRDARFLKDGVRYLVAASADAETKLLVSKVRPKRGEDPRCSANDPIYTRLADGTAIDSGIFAGVKGHGRDVLMAFLKPLGVVVGVLAALVTVKYVLIFGWRGLRLAVRHAFGRVQRQRRRAATARS